MRAYDGARVRGPLFMVLVYIKRYFTTNLH